MAEQGYAIEHHGRAFTPDGAATIANVAEHNAQLEARELAAWAERPERALMYYQFPQEHGGARSESDRHLEGRYRVRFGLRCNGATVSTWLGTVTGKITEARVYRHNFGARFVSLRVLGTNGAEYWGRASWDGGNCVVLRKVRGAR